jgi:hypothetical protein
MSNVMKIRPVGAELFHADGRTVIRTDMTKLIVDFRSFVNAPKKMVPKMCNEHQKAGPVLYESQNAAVIELSFVVIVDGDGGGGGGIISSSSSSSRPKLY